MSDEPTTPDSQNPAVPTDAPAGPVPAPEPVVSPDPAAPVVPAPEVPEAPAPDAAPAGDAPVVPAPGEVAGPPASDFPESTTGSDEDAAPAA